MTENTENSFFDFINPFPSTEELKDDKKFFELLDKISKLDFNPGWNTTYNINTPDDLAQMQSYLSFLTDPRQIDNPKVSSILWLTKPENLKQALGLSENHVNYQKFRTTLLNHLSSPTHQSFSLDISRIISNLHACTDILNETRTEVSLKDLSSKEIVERFAKVYSNKKHTYPSFLQSSHTAGYPLKNEFLEANLAGLIKSSTHINLQEIRKMVAQSVEQTLPTTIDIVKMVKRPSILRLESLVYEKGRELLSTSFLINKIGSLKGDKNTQNITSNLYISISELSEEQITKNLKELIKTAKTSPSHAHQENSLKATFKAYTTHALSKTNIELLLAALFLIHLKTNTAEIRYLSHNSMFVAVKELYALLGHAQFDVAQMPEAVQEIYNKLNTLYPQDFPITSPAEALPVSFGSLFAQLYIILEKEEKDSKDKAPKRQKKEDYLKALRAVILKTPQLINMTDMSYYSSTKNCRSALFSDISFAKEFINPYPHLTSIVPKEYINKCANVDVIKNMKVSQVEKLGKSFFTKETLNQSIDDYLDYLLRENIKKTDLLTSFTYQNRNSRDTSFSSSLWSPEKMGSFIDKLIEKNPAILTAQYLQEVITSLNERIEKNESVKLLYKQFGDNLKSFGDTEEKIKLLKNQTIEHFCNTLNSKCDNINSHANDESWTKVSLEILNLGSFNKDVRLWGGMLADAPAFVNTLKKKSLTLKEADLEFACCSQTFALYLLGQVRDKNIPSNQLSQYLPKTMMNFISACQVKEKYVEFLEAMIEKTQLNASISPVGNSFVKLHLTKDKANADKADKKECASWSVKPVGPEDARVLGLIENKIPSVSQTKQRIKSKI